MPLSVSCASSDAWGVIATSWWELLFCYCLSAFYQNAPKSSAWLREGMSHAPKGVNVVTVCETDTWALVVFGVDPSVDASPSRSFSARGGLSRKSTRSFILGHINEQPAVFCAATRCVCSRGCLWVSSPGCVSTIRGQTVCNDTNDSIRVSNDWVSNLWSICQRHAGYSTLNLWTEVQVTD